MGNDLTDIDKVTLQAFCAGITAESDLTVAEWADTYRVLSPKASAEPGRWRTSRTPYLRQIMEFLSPNHPCQRVVVMAGAQVGKTECGNNWIGYVISRSPAPMLMVQPTVEVAKRVSKQRLAPMIEATEVLSARVKEARSRDAGNTTFVKEFDGGLLIMTGANSAAGLRSMPIRFLFLDEIDEYPGDLDGQGDPISLAEKRTTTFSRRKILMTSTPTIKGLSRIEREFLLSDQRRYFVPCPHCGNMDWLRWENIRWTERDPDTAQLMCMACTQLIDEGHKGWMLERGEWRATAEGDGRTAGFHVSALYSPPGWKSWAECAAEFLSSKDDPFRLKTWVNTVLGETWEERGDSIEAHILRARCERYAAEVPPGVGVLVAAVDVQGDRLEAQVVGFGSAEESWLVAFNVIMGDPSRAAVWHELDRFLTGKFRHQSGQELPINVTVVDSGGHHTEEVYRYCRARIERRVYAIKGGTIAGRPLVERPTTTNAYKVPLFILCVDTGKDIIMSRYHIHAAGPGYIHLPDWVDDEYLDQLTSEKSVRKYVKGRGSVREWVKLRDRNEAFDLMVYSLGALYICGHQFIRTLPERAAKWAEKVEPKKEPAVVAAAIKKPRSTWVTRW